MTALLLWKYCIYLLGNWEFSRLSLILFELTLHAFFLKKNLKWKVFGIWHNQISSTWLVWCNIVTLHWLDKLCYYGVLMRENWASQLVFHWTLEIYILSLLKPPLNYASWGQTLGSELCDKSVHIIIFQIRLLLCKHFEILWGFHFMVNEFYHTVLWSFPFAKDILQHLVKQFSHFYLYPQKLLTWRWGKEQLFFPWRDNQNRTMYFCISACS